MIKPSTLLTLVALALGIQAGAATAAETCPNAAIRNQQRTTNLPECRAYELVTPDSNHGSAGANIAGLSLADGNTMEYQMIDPPVNAKSGTVFSMVRAHRDPNTGWSGEGLNIPITSNPSVFWANHTFALAADLSSVVEETDQPLVSGSVPSGANLYVRRSDGTYRLITTQVGLQQQLPPLIPTFQTNVAAWGATDFSHVFLWSYRPILPSAPESSIYSWSEAGGLKLASVLPGGAPAQGGNLGGGDLRGLLLPASSDGKYTLFINGGELYLRVDEASTIALGSTSVDISQPVYNSDSAGITPDGSAVFFSSRTELTGSSNTGGGSGRDIYRYDTASGQLVDITPDANPADAAGAAVSAILGVSPDGAYVYFIAQGDLAPGGVSGGQSLYLWHENHIEFIANAGGIFDEGRIEGFFVSADGKTMMFSSTDPLTGYNNTDPVTGIRHAEVFEYIVGKGVTCASCRVDGSRPTADSLIPSRNEGAPTSAPVRAISDDGSRVFFDSADAVVPQASSGHSVVYEYANGAVAPLTPVGGTSDAHFFGASASGDDVFVSTYDTLLANPNGGDFAIYDARVDGGFPVAVTPECVGESCRGTAVPPPPLPAAASVLFAGVDELTADASQALRVTVSNVKAVHGATGALRVKAPTAGRLLVSGTGLERRTSRVSKAGEVMKASLILTKKAAKSLRRKGLFKTTVKVTFSPPVGISASVSVPIVFKARSTRKGR